MTKLEDVKNGSRISGIVAGQAAEIVSVEWIGDQAINVVYRDPAVGIAQATLYRDNETHPFSKIQLHLKRLLDRAESPV